MKVDKFGRTVKPKERRFKVHSMLAMDDGTFGYIAPHGEGINGVPFNRAWKTPTFYFEKPLIPKPNFFRVSSAVACDEKAREMVGEFPPIRVEGEYWIYSITNTINVVGHQKSDLQESVLNGESFIIQRMSILFCGPIQCFGEL